MTISPSGPQLSADMAVVMFDPPRMFYGRERALWTPAPHQLAGLGAWIKRCGVHTMAVVLPHAQGTLPEALKRGLANLDEHALAALNLERLLIVRTAQKPVIGRQAPCAAPHRIVDAGGLQLHGAAQRTTGARHQGRRVRRSRAAVIARRHPCGCTGAGLERRTGQRRAHAAGAGAMGIAGRN